MKRLLESVRHVVVLAVVGLVVTMAVTFAWAIWVWSETWLQSGLRGQRAEHLGDLMTRLQRVPQRLVEVHLVHVVTALPGS